MHDSLVSATIVLCDVYRDIIRFEQSQRVINLHSCNKNNGCE